MDLIRGTKVKENKAVIALRRTKDLSFINATNMLSKSICYLLSPFDHKRFGGEGVNGGGVSSHAFLL